MTQEDKNLLLKVLCAGLPYGLKIWTKWDKNPSPLTVSILGNYWYTVGNDIKPYLRPMSSMTEEEKSELKEYLDAAEVDYDGFGYSEGGTLEDYISSIPYSICAGVVDWLNKNKFDYRGLIPMGLALEATKGMYKTK